MTEKTERKLISIATIADAIDVNVKTLRPIVNRLVAEKKIGHVPIGQRKRFRPSIIDQIIDLLEVKPCVKK